MFKIKVLLLIFAAIFLISTATGGCAGEKITPTLAALGDDEDDGITDPFRDILEEFNKILPDGIDADSEALNDSLSLSAILDGLLELFKSGGGRVLSFATLIFALTLILILSEGVGNGLSQGTLAVRGVVIVTSLPVFLSLSGLVSRTAESLSTLGGFFSSAIPTFTAVLSLGGREATAGVTYSGMNLSFALVSGILSGLLLPLCSLLFALTPFLCSGGEEVGRMGNGIRSLFFFALGAVSFIVVSAFALQSTLSARADSAAMRTVKYAVSGMLPMVGASVSQTLSVLSSGLEYASGIVGVGAVAAVVSIIGAPFVELLLYRAILSIMVSISELCGASSGKGMLSSFLFSLDALIAVFAMAAVVYTAQILIFLKSAVAYL